MGRHVVTLRLSEAETPPASAHDDRGPISAPLSAPALARRRRPGGLAVSLLLHALAVAMAIEATAIVRAPSLPSTSRPTSPRADAVFLPPPVLLRQILGLRARPPARTAAPRDRISIGPPAPMRRREPLVLHRDDDLTAVAKGMSMARAGPTPAEAQPAPSATRPGGASGAEGGGLVPPSVADAPTPGPILASLRRFEAGGGDAGPFGVPTGAGGQMGPLFFDPEGADFTAWIQRFKNEVYRNWIVPPSAGFGWSGQVDFEFVVDRSGAMTEVRLLQSSGTGAYDRAARNALLGSRLLPLPADFAPATVTMKVGFVYNGGAPEGGRRGH
jgi:TonB family protein